MRNRNKNSIKRRKVCESNRNVIHNKVVMELESSIAKSSHTLIELSEKQ